MMSSRKTIFAIFIFFNIILNVTSFIIPLISLYAYNALKHDEPFAKVPYCYYDEYWKNSSSVGYPICAKCSPDRVCDGQKQCIALESDGRCPAEVQNELDVFTPHCQPNQYWHHFPNGRRGCVKCPKDRICNGEYRCVTISSDVCLWEKRDLENYINQRLS
ncbi:hypothetical protein PV328_000675 [Microctonus aethiopoides]|uniref:Uncharacterized protein n=1 Tax=Microctonus aethiopoides TaxID=144406 RepID=A0AA39FWL0_9HYME|nr:hypothetical protein PV328_000675 [Microctonus aethiopoides]